MIWAYSRYEHILVFFPHKIIDDQQNRIAEMSLEIQVRKYNFSQFDHSLITQFVINEDVSN